MAGAALLWFASVAGIGHVLLLNVMASERSIRDYARRTLFYDYRRVTNRLVANLYPTSHQAGAQHAIAAFLSGYLNVDMRLAFSRLTQRVILVWGKQDLTTPVSKASALLELNPKAELEVFRLLSDDAGTGAPGTVQMRW